MAPISFRNSKIIYYGPHPCTRCGVNIVKMGNDWGDSAFTYPDTPIYPNTEWHVHVCDPSLILQYKASGARHFLSVKFPNIEQVRTENSGWFVISEKEILTRQTSFHYSWESAWIEAFELQFVGQDLPVPDPRTYA